MSTIKVQCECGQRYAFEVEPVNGRMPHPVACPVCGADGTSAANALIAHTATAEPAMAYAPIATPRLEDAIAASAVQGVVTPIPRASARPKLLPGQIERPQAEVEGKAKIFWGEPTEEVVKFLMRNNIAYEEAAELVTGWLDERAAATRSNGIGRIVTGCGMICVPIVTCVIFASMGFIPLKIFAVTAVVGLWGTWRALKGTIMVVSPSSEKGDVADQ